MSFNAGPSKSSFSTDAGRDDQRHQHVGEKSGAAILPSFPLTMREALRPLFFEANRARSSLVPRDFDRIAHVK
jgi:hypothetical protein